MTKGIFDVVKFKGGCHLFLSQLHEGVVVDN